MKKGFCSKSIFRLSVITLFTICSIWTINETNKWKSQAEYSSKKMCNYITLDTPNGIRLGNYMFMYAALFATAKHNNKLTFLKDVNYPLRKVFKISVTISNVLFDKSTFIPLPEYGVSIFNDSVFHLDCDKNYSMSGFRQSYKYFESYDEDIRKEFTFVDQVERTCVENVKKIFDSKCRNSSKTCLLIGVHMRRGDFVSGPEQHVGHVPASPEYLHKAINFFTNRFDKYLPIFIILGDDFDWNMKHSPKISNVIVSKASSAEVDLCILSKCNHSIISTGTYGWMGAFLAGGEVTYMKHQCRPDSAVCQKYNEDDYINKKWKWTAL